MRVLIVGCGYVGLRLGAELVRQGHSVWGLRRSPHAGSELGATGIAPVTGDITVPDSLPFLGAGYDWVVHCVSATGAGAGGYQKVFVEGTNNLLSWLSPRPPTRLVYTGSTSVYGQTDGSWVDETSPVTPVALTARVLVQAEELLLKAADSGFPAVILRAAGIYGPGRAYWLRQAREQRAALPAGDRFLNMIHRDDLVGAVIAALTKGTAGRIYNAVDDQPVRARALVEWLYLRLGYPIASVLDGPGGQPSKRGQTDKRVVNQRLKSELGFRFHFPTFQEGYAALLESE